ncbi:MAG: hypothetical protein AB1Z63_15540 [Candidatus Limnocylindrales bacterium]
MTSFDDLDRRLTARLDERVAPRAPDGLHEAINERIEGTAQRPAWATLERWIPMETRAQFGAVPRAVVVFALLTLLTLVLATALAIGADSPRRLPEPFGPTANGLIAYESAGDIYVVEPDGTDLRQITTGSSWEGGPSWSRDGTMLAYWRGAGPTWETFPHELVVTDIEGDDHRVIARVDGESSELIWSEDGSEVMWSAVVPELVGDDCIVSFAGACGSRIFVASADGSGSRMIGDPNLDARSPALSPDGHTVAFGGGEAAWEALYLMEWDGSEVRRLDTDIPPRSWAFNHQSWSPDGRRIATQDGRVSQRVWVVDLDESGELEAVRELGTGFWPEYAPDGRLRWVMGNFSTIVVAVPDEPESTMTLIDDVYEDVWSPDGQRLAAVRDGHLVILDRDGENVSVIAPAEESVPAWQRVAE